MMKRGRPRKLLSSVEVEAEEPVLPEPVEKKAKKGEQEEKEKKAGRESAVENVTPALVEEDKKAEAPTLTRSQIKSAKIVKLKELLSCIQSYAQFTASQLAGQKKLVAAKTSKKAAVGAELFIGELRDYQLEGVRWLQMLHDLAVNGILADEMGLGKTVMVIAMIAKVIQSGAPGPFLVIAPLSTLPNWVNEIQRFTPDIPMVLFHGDAKKRKLLRAEIESTHKLPKKYLPAEKVRPIVVTSYEMLIADANYLSRIDWRMLIVDEAQRLKNERCVLRNRLRKFSTPRRLILTGTPIQNSLTELWSLMSFLISDIFSRGALSSFESLLDEILSDDSSLWITDETDARQKEEIVTLLHNILRPFILRRLKSDVDLTIPPKKELVVRCSLTKKQAELYGKLIDMAIVQAERTRRGELEDDEMASTDRRERQKTIFFGVNDEEEDEELAAQASKIVIREEPKVDDRSVTSEEEEDDTKETEGELSVDYWIESWGRLAIRNLMMQLRKCVNHPYLFRTSYVINEDFIKVSCKLRILDAMLKELLGDRSAGHKIIIYSQFVMNLDVLAQYCDYRNWKFVRIDGQTNLEDRSKAIKTFNTDLSVPIFLVSTRAGGLGINLTAADTVFLYDSDWNPQMDLQARDRCHRIGQTRPVVVYRLIVSNTIDQRMWECATGKRRLERIVLHQSAFQHAADSLLGAASGGSSNQQELSLPTQKLSFSVDDLITLLKSRDWEDHDDSALNFDGPKGEADRRVAELLDRSDLEAEWRQTQAKSAAAKAQAQADASN